MPAMRSIDREGSIAALAREALFALASERATGLPVTRADAPQLFALHDQAMHAARQQPLCGTGRFEYAGHRFYLVITWSAAGEVQRIEVRNANGAVVLVGNGNGPVFLPRARGAKDVG